MITTIPVKLKWTTKDLESLPDDNNRYEIIKGELLMTRAPAWRHQKICNNIATYLNIWSLKTGLGETVQTPGIIFTDADNVIPDVVWISKKRLEILLDESEHLTGAPELIVEVLSRGTNDERRDKEDKLQLYSNQGVLEYWIVDYILEKIDIYRRDIGELILVNTLFINDTITSPNLPDFNCNVSQIFN